MMFPNLPDELIEILQWLVLEVRSGRLNKEFTIFWKSDGFDIIGGSQVKKGPFISPGLLNDLTDFGMLKCSPRFHYTSTGLVEVSRDVEVKDAAFTAVDQDNYTVSAPVIASIPKEMPPKVQPEILEKPVRDSQLADELVPAKDTGQLAQAKDTAQLVPAKDTGQLAPSKDTGQLAPAKDTGQLRSQMDVLFIELVNEVKPCLKSEDLNLYIKSIQEFKSQWMSRNPNKEILRKSIQTISLLGDIEAPLAVTVRIWPKVYTLLVRLAKRFEENIDS